MASTMPLDTFPSLSAVASPSVNVILQPDGSISMPMSVPIQIPISMHNILPLTQPSSQMLAPVHDHTISHHHDPSHSQAASSSAQAAAFTNSYHLFQAHPFVHLQAVDQHHAHPHSHLNSRTDSLHQDHEHDLSMSIPVSAPVSIPLQPLSNLVSNSKLLADAPVATNLSLLSEAASDTASGAEDSALADEPPPCDVIIPPPPIETYPDFQAGLDAIRAWGKRHGVDYSLKKSIKNRNQEIHRYILMCTRHGKLDNTRKLKDDERIRLKRASKKVGCPMGLIYAATERLNPRGRWTIRYKRGQKSYLHNHVPAEKALPGHRRLDCTDEVRRTILVAQETGVNPAQTLAILKAQNPDISLTLQDIRNLRKLNLRNEDATKT